MAIKSVRLSVAMRNNIRDSMIEAWKKHQPIPFDLKKLEVLIGEDFYKQKYGSIVKELKKIPNQMLRMSGSINVQIAGKVCKYDLSEAKPMEYNNQYNQSIVLILDEVPVNVTEFNNAVTAVEKWEAKRNEFIEEITAILNSVASTIQLLEIWPEAEQYLPPFAADPSKGINLPALKTSRLNTLLGIK